jgi:cell division protein FtsA
MEQVQYIVAIEIGSSKIVGAIADKSSIGLVSVSHLVEEKLINCVRYGCVQNVENVRSAINRIIKELERRIDGRITQTYVGISGRSLHSEPDEISRSLDASRAITDETIERIVREASSRPVKSYETITVVPSAYFVDKTATTTPVGQYGSSIKIKVNRIVAKPTIKLNLDRVMNFGVTAKEYLVTPIAVAEHVLTDSERSLGCILVDIGAETTTVVVYKDNALAFLSTLPLGGRNVTRDIMNGLTVVEETAERVKKNINNPLDPANVDAVVIEDVKSSDAAKYIEARVGEIIANINQQIDNSGLKQDVRNLVLLGGGALMQGLPQKLEDVTKCKVRLAQCPATLNILNHNYNRPENIELFSLLAKAAELIEPNETCLERRTFESPDVNPRPSDAQPVNEPTKAPKKDKQKTSWIRSMARKFSQYMSEDEEEI